MGELRKHTTSTGILKDEDDDGEMIGGPTDGVLSELKVQKFRAYTNSEQTGSS